MAFSNYSDAFSYTEKIIMDYAADLSEKIVDKCIETLKELTDTLLPDGENCLENTWEEICVQCQSDESVYWDSYDDTVYDILYQEVRALPGFSLAALQYAEDFSESESDYMFDLDTITCLLKSSVYEKAGMYKSDSVLRFIEAHEYSELEDEDSELDDEDSE